MDDQPIEVRSLTDDDLQLAKDVGLDLKPFTQESSLSRRGFREITEDDKGVSWGDYGRAVGVGAIGLASGAAALMEYTTRGKVGGDARRSLEKTSDELTEGMGPRAQRAMSAEFFPDKGKQSILDDFTSSLGLKSAAAIPSVVASIIPAGLAARALSVGGAAARLGIAEGAAGAAQRGAIAAGVSRATNSVMNGGDVAQQLYSTVDKMSDADLRTYAPIYAGYRSMMSEREARRLYMNDVAGAAPVIGMIIGAATPGVETMIARRLGGEAAKGVGRGAVTGAATEAGQEFVESSTGEFLTQDALVKAGLKGEMDWGKVIAQGLEGALVGAAMGGVAGGVSGIGGKPSAVPTPATNNAPPPPPANNGLIDPTLAAALAAAQQAPPPAPPAPPPSAPPAAAPTTAPPSGTVTISVLDPSNVTPELKEALDRANGVTPREAEPPKVPTVDQLEQVSAPPDIANKIANDAGQTKPETVAGLEAQQKKLVDGLVPAQMFTPGETELPLPEGMQRVETPKGVFHFNPKARLKGRLITAAAVRGLAFQGSENLILGLGDKNKAEVAAEAQAKREPIIAAVERTPEGTEVKAAATTPSDAPRIVDQLQKNASPGNTTQVEPVPQVLEQRAEPATAPSTTLPAVADAFGNMIADANALLKQSATNEYTGGGYKFIHNKGSDELHLVRLEDGGEILIAENASKQPFNVLMRDMQRAVTKAGADVDLQEANLRGDVAPEAITPINSEQVAQASTEAAPAVDDDAYAAAVRQLVGNVAPAPEAPKAAPNKGEKAKAVAKARTEKAAAPKPEAPQAKGPVTKKGKPPAPGRVLTDKAAAVLDKQASNISRGGRGLDTDVVPRPKDRNYIDRFLTRADNAFRDLGENAPEHYRTGRAAAAEIKALGKGPKPEKAPHQAVLTAAMQTEYDLEQAGTPRYAIGQGKTGAVVGKATKQAAEDERELAKLLEGKKEALKNEDELEAAQLTAGKRQKAGYSEASKSEEVSMNEQITARSEELSPEELLMEKQDPDRQKETDGFDENETVAKSQERDRPAVELKGDEGVGFESREGTFTQVKARAPATAEQREKAKAVILQMKARNKEIKDALAGRAPPDILSGLDMGLGGDLLSQVRAVIEATSSLDELADLSAKLNSMNDAQFKDWLVTTLSGNPDLWIKANVANDLTGISHFKAGNLGRIVTELASEPIKAERTMTLKAAMQEARRDAGPSRAPLAELMHDFLFKRITKLVGDMKVRVLSDEAMNRATLSGTAQGAYRPAANEILLRSSEINGSQGSYQLILHEALHGALANLIDTNPAFKRRIDALRKHVLSKVSEDEAEQYGLKDAHEFISEAMTNPAFQDVLSKVTLTEQERESLGLQDSSLYGKVTKAFDALVRIVANTFGLPPQSRSALEQAIRLTDEGLQMREEKGQGAEFSKMDEAQIRKWEERLGDLAPSDLLAKLANPKERFTNELLARGVEKAAAEKLAKNLVNMLGDQVTLGRALPLIKQLGVQFGTSKAPGAKGKQAVQKSKARAAARPPRPAPVKPTPPTYTPTQKITNAATDKGSALMSKWRNIAVWGSTLDQLRQIYKGVFVDDKGDALDRLVQGIQRMAPYSTAKREAADKLAQKFIDYAKADPKKADDLANLAVDATMSNVQLGPNADNKHLKLKWRSWQSLVRLPEMQQRYANQLDDGGRALYQEMTEFYRNTQNELTQGLIDNILTEVQVAPTDRDAFIARVMGNTMTKADEALFVDKPKVLDAMKDATELRAIRGDYFPLMRHGDHVVTTNEKIKDTGGGKEIEPGKVEFRAATQREAMQLARSFAEGSDMDVLSVKKSPDFATSTDFGVVVELQTKGVHFFDSEQDALKWRRENEAFYDQVSQVQPVRDTVKGGTDLTTGQFKSLMATIDSQPKVNDKTREMMKSVMQQAAARMMSGNRVQKRSIARRNVRGASTDFGRNIITYGQATAGYLSKIRYMPQVREALKSITDIAKDDFAPNAAVRVKLLNEISARIDQNVVDIKELPRPVRNLLTATFLGKLASPMYNVINGMQPTMVTYPVLAGEFGTIDAGKALGGAYATLGFTDAVWGGLRNTYLAGKQITNTGLLDTSDIIGSMKKRFAGEKDGVQLSALMTELQERGAMSAGGFELSQTLVEGSATNKALAKVERIARQMPQAVENINRAVAMIAAYRLSFAKAKADAKKDGKTDAEADVIADAKARAYAFDIVMNTQGDYSAANAPRFFNKGYLSLALMFKKYVQMMSYVLVDMAHKSFKGASHEERVAARKAFAQLFAVQIAFAGALSLPGLEIAKAGFMLAAFFGAGDGWDEQEEKLRKLADKHLGKYGGELFMKGVISRALDLDISQRVSLSDMYLFGEPKSYNKEGTNAYLAQLLLGAPGSTAQGILDAVKDAGNGDWMKAAYKGIPIKVVSDFIKAVDQYGEGKITRRELVTNALGARTGRQAEVGREIGESVRKRDAMQARRKALQSEYLRFNATPGQLAVTKAKIAAFNKEVPFNLRIGGLDKIRTKEALKAEALQGTR